MTKRERETLRKRLFQTETFPGNDDLSSLANGIIKEKKPKEKKKLCSPGQPFHDADGLLSSEADATSWSHQKDSSKSGCTKGQVQYKNKKRLIPKRPAGRGGIYRLKDKTKYSEPAKILEQRRIIEKTIRKFSEFLVEKFEDELNESNGVGNCLVLLNRFAKSKDGKLFNSPGKK